MSTLQFGLASDAGPTVPWTDVEAVVATKETVTDSSTIGMGNGTFVFDGQVGYALSRVELVGCGDGLCRADIDTGSALSAVVALGVIREEFREW